MENEDLAIGIDLGTTFSCVAVLRDGKVEIIPNDSGENLTPSIVSFIDESEDVLVGEEAMNQLIKQPKKTIYSIKRLIGRNINDEEIIKELKSNFWNYDVVDNIGQWPQIKLENQKGEIKYYYPEQISNLILKKLIKSARNYLEQDTKNAVITVPAYFNNSQRTATKLAAQSAGINVLRVINEPTAAALAYGLIKKIPKNENNFIDFYMKKDKDEEKKIIETTSNQKEQLILIFDLGGGTLDITLLAIINNDNYRVKDIDGDTHLGGDDFDKIISNYCLSKFCKTFGIDENVIKKNNIAMNRLKIASEKAKKMLSYNNETNIEIDDFYKNEMIHVHLTRPKFEEICKELYNKIKRLLTKMKDKLRNGIKKIEEIILVGGSTRMPKIKEIIVQEFQDININDSINPDETVAYGAAILAAKLMKKEENILNNVILMDITPFSLGIEIKNESKDEKIKEKGKIMSIIIKKRSKLPIKNTKHFMTTDDFQETASILVYEGEKKYVIDNHLLGEFNLTNLPKKPKGEVKIDVTFEVDINGILYVSAVETSTKIKNSIKIINDRGGLSENEIKEKNKNINLINNKNDIQIQNYKKDLKEYYKYYLESKNLEDKMNYIYIYSKILTNFLNS